MSHLSFNALNRLQETITCPDCNRRIYSEDRPILIAPSGKTFCVSCANKKLETMEVKQFQTSENYKLKSLLERIETQTQKMDPHSLNAWGETVPLAPLLEGLDCDICMGESRKPPLTTPCGHSFCQICIGRLPDDGLAKKCPTCRQSFLMDETVKNHALRGLVLAIKEQATNPLQEERIVSDRECDEILLPFKEKLDEDRVACIGAHILVRISASNLPEEVTVGSLIEQDHLPIVQDLSVYFPEELGEKYIEAFNRMLQTYSVKGVSLDKEARLELEWRGEFKGRFVFKSQEALDHFLGVICSVPRRALSPH